MKRRALGTGFCFTLVAFAVIGAVMAEVRKGGEEGKETASATIAIDNFRFTPKEITVAKGTTVIWLNRDDAPHTIVSTEKKFESKALDTDDRFSFTFTNPGTYAYFCSVHPIMTGKVIVK